MSAAIASSRRPSRMAPASRGSSSTINTRTPDATSRDISPAYRKAHTRWQRRAPCTEGMSLSEGITVYGCGPDEAALFRELAPRFRVAVTITQEPISVVTAVLAAGHRCVSVDHKTQVTNETLL